MTELFMVQGSQNLGFQSLTSVFIYYAKKEHISKGQNGVGIGIVRILSRGYRSRFRVPGCDVEVRGAQHGDGVRQVCEDRE
ncbi:hypothetical protein ACRRTK_021222 [Alexandromys fortis]